MLANLNDVLPQAQRGGYAVGLFNTIDTDMLEAVIAAAERMRAPVIIGTAEVLLPYGELRLIAPSIIAAAHRASVPVVVHYDHGLTFDRCMEALKLGFTSVMFDGSAGDPSSNRAATREMVRIAHAMGATVEGKSVTSAKRRAATKRRPTGTRRPTRRRNSSRRRAWTRWRSRSGRRTARTRRSRSSIWRGCGQFAHGWIRRWCCTADPGCPMTISAARSATALPKSIFSPICAAPGQTRWRAAAIIWPFAGRRSRRFKRRWSGKCSCSGRTGNPETS